MKVLNKQFSFIIHPQNVEDYQNYFNDCNVHL